MYCAAVNRFNGFAGQVFDDDFVAECLRRCVFVFNLRFSGDLCASIFDVEVLCVNVNAGGAEIGVERQAFDRACR